ncbi:interferon gamma receptor 2 [Entelurus aequoreus]|uniref:interferon gamma receptor 2 n=1 Tax=Entelurus aequoreus TaxID=161455 RepID=UPI002B1D4294|nr:interferon gamma receptor 2 [Entelurus aequoreus]
MVLLLMCFHFIAQVLSEAPPDLPQNVLFDNWQLTWTPATEEHNVTYTVRYHSLDAGIWKDVPTCKRISFTSCNVTFMKAEADHGCVMMGVLAERHGLTSELARACSKQGFSCSPEVVLSARPDFLTVHLSRNSGFAQEGYHVKHRIYFGKKGEPFETYDAVSSVSFHEVKEGEHYCASVQYLYFDHLVGVASCTQCQVIPQSSEATKHLEAIVAVVIVLVILIPLFAYICLFQRKRIKELLQPSYKIPNHFFLDVRHPYRIPISSNSPTEVCDDIASVDFIKQ